MSMYYHISQMVAREFSSQKVSFSRKTAKLDIPLFSTCYKNTSR